MRDATHLLICSFVLLFGLLFPIVSGSCTKSSECEQFQICGSDQLCRTKSLWTDYGWKDAAGSVLIFIGAMLATGGGIGGGGVFIPLLTLVVGMTAKQAIPISQATIFGGSLVNLSFNVWQKHPNLSRRTRPLIDYTAVMMFTPMLLAGTTIGVLLNVMLPAWLVTALLVVIMGYISRRTTLKALSAWRQEYQAELERDHSSIVPLEPSQEELNRYPESNEDRFDMLMILFIWSFVVVFSSLKGSKSGGFSVIGVESCSTTYWLLSCALIILLTMATFVLGKHLQHRMEPKDHSRDHDNGGEIYWDSRSVIMYPALSVVAGIVGGLLGIGGGMVLAPLLLEIGIHSRVVAATSASAVLVTSSSAMIQYFILDLLIPSYSLFFAIVGAVATALGQVTFDYLVQKYKRTSLLSLSIALMIITATILLVISGVMNTIHDVQIGHVGFSSPC